MAEVFSAERIDPGRLSEAQRKELSGKLYQVHRAVFAGLDERGFDHYVVNSTAEETRILLYRNRQKDLIGYFGVHRFEKTVDGRPVVVFRAEVGLLPEYRQRDADLSFWLTEAARFKFRHPGKPVFFLYAPVSPSFYAMVARYTYKIYPGRSLNVPPAALKLMTELAQQFGLEQVDESEPLVRQVGWITTATDREKRFWRSSGNPFVRFYLAANPRFDEGRGLLTLIPLTLTNTLLSLFGVAFHTLKKKLRRHQTQVPPAHRGPA